MIENAFGIMNARWRVLRRTLLASQETAKAIILAVVCLHNLLVLNEENVPPGERRYFPPGFVDSEGEDGEIVPGMWRRDVLDGDVPQPVEVDYEEFAAANGFIEGELVRERLMDFFLGPGSVPWQWVHLRHL